MAASGARREELLSWWHALAETHKDISQGIAKTTLTLSGGALALSLTFMRDIVGPGTPRDPCLLGLSWFFFVGSLVLVLLSYLRSESEIRQALEGVGQAMISDAEPEEPDGPSRGLAAGLAAAAAAAFVAGVVILAVFAYLNLPS